MQYKVFIKIQSMKIHRKYMHEKPLALDLDLGSDLDTCIRTSLFSH